MRVLIISCLLVLYVAVAGAQDYYYVTVIRGVIRKEDRSVLKTGDKLSADAKLLFANKDCRLLLLHPQKGRFILEPGSKEAQSSGEFSLFLKSYLRLQTETVKLSSRGDVGVDDFFTTRNTEGSRLLFIGDTKFDLNHSGYIITDPDNNFFFLQYIDTEGKVYNNKLLTAHDSLLINETSFLFNESLPADKREVKLAYVKNYNSNREVKQVATFKPVFYSAAECKKLILTTRQTIGGTREKIIEEVYSQLLYLYGKPYIETLNYLFERL